MDPAVCSLVASLAGRASVVAGLALVVLAGPARAAERASATRAYFGAVHVHTGYSFDAFTNGSPTVPSDAYEWARGKAIPGGGGPDHKILKPLDFYAVSDHAEYMGVFRQMANPASPLSKTELAKGVTSKDPGVRMQTFAQLLREMSAGQSRPELTDPAISRPIWQEIVETADRYYEPGKFTTFPALEWTSNPNKRNLHRVVLSRARRAFRSSRSRRSTPTTPRSSGAGWCSDEEREGPGGRQHGRREEGDVREQHRQPGARDRVERPGLRPRGARLLLRPRARDPDAALEHPRAAKLGIELPAGLPATIQERAWSSPIWYAP